MRINNDGISCFPENARISFCVEGLTAKELKNILDCLFENGVDCTKCSSKDNVSDKLESFIEQNHNFISKYGCIEKDVLTKKETEELLTNSWYKFS